MTITGTGSYIKIDLENGYVVKAEGERLINRRFVAYKDTMKFWEPPHEKEAITKRQIEEIIAEVQRDRDEDKVWIFFE